MKKSLIQRFPNDVKAWRQKVEDDIKWAQLSLDNKYYPQVCFVAQQIIEKILKTYLLAQNQVVEKIHKLPILLKQCSELDGSFKQFLPEVKNVDRYYITTRYPPSFGGAE